MTMKGLLFTFATLLLAQSIIAESKEQAEITVHHASVREIVEVEMTIKKYYYVDNTEIGYSRDEAKTLCNSLNMHLVEFETGNEWLAVFNWLENSPYTWLRFWTGALRDAGNAKWYWENTGEEIVDAFWTYDEPNLDVSTAACIDFSHTISGWDDVECNSYLFGAMCES